jgi:phosphatidylinositol-3-phosphatase
MEIQPVNKFSAIAMALLATTGVGAAWADDDGPKVDHVIVIMMENHGYSEIIGSPYMPFTNKEAAQANLATNYFAVAHPSLTNYLEVVGGSNFGILNDKSPNWGSTTCVSTLRGGPSNENSSDSSICPVSGDGIDEATPALDIMNETTGLPGDINIDGTHSYQPAETVGKTIADQLAAAGLTWKTYQESLPLTGAYGVNTSNGFFSNNSKNLDAPEQAAGMTPGSVAALYRAKHNPFIYFANVQNSAVNGQIPGVVSFEGQNGLWADLATGHVPTYSFVAPNQCHDQHGAGNYPPSPTEAFDDVFCSNNVFDGGLRQQGDIELQALVGAIKASPIWSKEKTAIVILWDENDYSTAPVTNQVALIVDRNYGRQGVQSAKFYTHFSLLKSVEAALGLACLNHACDAGTAAMSDLFGLH